MTSTEPQTHHLDLRHDPGSEALLLQAARDGSAGAFGVLYEHHRDHAVATAKAALPRADASVAEDVAEVAFLRVFTALRNGKGPTDTLRFYLSTAVRREAWRTQRRRRKQAELVDRWAVDEPVAAEQDPVAPEPLDEHDPSGHVLLSEAFRGLSERWRNVLWLSEVEGRKPAEIATLLGVSAGTASALAYRARQGLLAAYLTAYRDHGAGDACREINQRLGAYVAAGGIAEGFADVVAHLEGCAACRDVSRGVDVMGGSFRAVAPFGLLTAGLWAKAITGSGALVGGAVATGGIAATGTSSTGITGGAATGGVAAGGVGGGAVAAVVAAVVVVAAAVAGYAAVDGSGGSTPRAEAAGPVPTQVLGTSAAHDAPPGGPASPTLTVPPTGASTTTPSPGSTSTTTSTSGVISAPVDPVVRPAATVPTAPPVVTSIPPKGPVTTTVPPSSTTTPSTTTTTRPALGPVQVSGRATKPDPEIDGALDPVPGVLVQLYDLRGSFVAAAVTDGAGRWAIKDVPAGRYQVIALVPPVYRPVEGPDPWTGLPWAALVGTVDVAGRDLDRIDLHLLDR